MKKQGTYELGSVAQLTSESLQSLPEAGITRKMATLAMATAMVAATEFGVISTNPTQAFADETGEIPSMLYLENPLGVDDAEPEWVEKDITYISDFKGPIALKGPIEASPAKVAAYHEARVAEQQSKQAAQSPATMPVATVSQAPTSPASQPVTTIASEVVHIDATPSMSPNTISVNGTIVPYTWTPDASTAPASGAGVWKGSDSTTDGSWCYFIGHHPGSFNPVMDLTIGNPVAVCDGNGQTRTYTVIDIFDVPNTTYWSEIEQRVTSHGESAILQTCVGDNAHYRIVVCA